ncbi:MAG: MFS transporter [Pseudomonadota bacterium]
MPVPHRIEFTLAFVVCLSAVAVDISLPAIPDILTDLDAPAAYGQWIVGIYLLGYAIGQIPFGVLADRVGRLPALRLGLLLFTLSSFATVLANSIEVLLVARCVQGIGGASASVLARAIVRDISSGDELTRLTAVLVASLAIATLLAPLFGSAIIHAADWSMVFSVSVIMGVAALPLTGTQLSETLARNEAGVDVFQQLRASALAFWCSRQSVWAAAVVGFTFFAYMGIVAGIAQVVVDAYGLSSVAVGLVFSGAVVFYVLAGRLGGRYAQRAGTRSLLKIGVVFMAISAVTCSLVLWIQPVDFWFFWFALLPFFIALGLVFPSATAMALEPLPEVAGFAASILGTFQILMSVIGAGIASAFFDGRNTSLLSVVIAGAAAVVLTYCLKPSTAGRNPEAPISG